VSSIVYPVSTTIPPAGIAIEYGTGHGNISAGNPVSDNDSWPLLPAPARSGEPFSGAGVDN